MKALIITDGTDSIKSIAKLIKESLKGIKTTVCSADKFEGTDLLAADVFFIGCQNPSPSSFSYLEEILAHINLAARKCGIFSDNSKVIKYLKGIVKDCEAATAELLVENIAKIKKSDINKLIKELKI